MDVGVLFTEHSMDVVFAHADRIMVLARGQLIAQGAPEAIRDDARVAEVYFGSGALVEPAGSQGAGGRASDDATGGRGG
jgi:ABC-type lipopolysaccharide export system ATPase subunit